MVFKRSTPWQINLHVEGWNPPAASQLTHLSAICWPRLGSSKCCLIGKEKEDGRQRGRYYEDSMLVNALIFVTFVNIFAYYQKERTFGYVLISDVCHVCHVLARI